MKTSLLRKVHKRIFERYIGKVFYESSTNNLADANGFRRRICRINQALNESGSVAPWMYTAEECRDFWSSIGNDNASVGNRPHLYAAKPSGFAEFLTGFWAPPVLKTDRILELGCNCGANLNHLYQLGYKDLCAVEINPNAIRQMNESFPHLAGSCKIHQGSLESVLPTLESGSVDLVFTMGVAMHIHPSSNFLFKEMVRISRKYICSIEPEADNSNYVFARNYRRVYEKHGCSQLKSALITKEAYPELHENNIGSVVRLMSVPKK